MELRHLRYFVAVAEEGSLTLAAARRLLRRSPRSAVSISLVASTGGVAILPRG
jgi:LysR family transcriptional regulator, hca operon transcriptional activator